MHQLSENNPEFEDIQPRLEVIKIAIAAHDFGQLALQIYQIKGASANLGATSMHLAAAKLEELAYNQEYRGINKLVLELIRRVCQTHPIVFNHHC